MYMNMSVKDTDVKTVTQIEQKWLLSAVHQIIKNPPNELSH